MNLEDFENYIKDKEWKEAKTFKDFAPHSYILSFPCKKMKRDKLCPLPEYRDPIESMAVCQQCQDARAEFEEIIMFIREHGERAIFMKKMYIMLRHNGELFWSYGDPLSTTWVLNRAIENDPRCKVKTIFVED